MPSGMKRVNTWPDSVKSHHKRQPAGKLARCFELFSSLPCFSPDAPPAIGRGHGFGLRELLRFICSKPAQEIAAGMEIFRSTRRSHRTNAQSLSESAFRVFFSMRLVSSPSGSRRPSKRYEPLRVLNIHCAMHGALKL